jgi:lipopolysaccharide transport system ATP-binding protein
MSTNDIALRVANLGKMYRLGREIPHASTLGGKIRQAVAAPFGWLASQMGQPSEEESLWALRNVSFEIKRGEVVGFIGNNGAGKSTLLKILSRITEPTEGYAEIHGRIAALLEVGTGMHPELTGREHIYMNGTVLGMKKREIDRKFNEIVEFSGVEKFLDTMVKHYSSGMRVRLGFAIAAHLEPEILVVDEVLAVGDADFQSKCLGKMQEVATCGRTILFVSHNMAAVERLCSRACIMEGGRLVADGETASIITKYLERKAENSDAPLGTRKDREGNGLLRFTEVRILGEEGKPIDRIASGKKLTIEISYETPNSLDATSFDVHVTFYTTRGQFMFTCSTAASGFLSECLPKNRKLSCEIPKLPLTAGDYPFNLYATVRGETADWVKDVGKVCVIGGDFYGTGRVVGHSDGFLVSNTWKLD